MAEFKIQEGKAPFTIPSIDEPCFTYYKIIGDISPSGRAPVIIAHGGPGAGHEYLLTFAELWQRYNLPVIFYDQIGCASSTHLPQKAGDHSFWQEQLFQDELDNLIDHLDLRRSGFDFLGHSWGGMLGAAFAARRPQGLRRLVLASALASKELAIQGTHLLRDQMPPDMRQALDEAEAKGEYDSPAYKRALDFYQRKHVCRADPFPPAELLPAFKNLSDTTVYRTMNGPSPLTTDGSLVGWTVISRLPNINVPTLVYNGGYDTSHDITQVPFFELIPRVRRLIFVDGGHICHLEGQRLRKNILKNVGEFLTQESPRVPYFPGSRRISA
ncbi:proline-specific peptidase [Nemania sp. FL0916]|nr:proline-specific peptidase [Nemania sp. FL0916]